MPPSKSIHSYPHFDFVELANRIVASQTPVVLLDLAKTQAINFRHRFYSWRILASTLFASSSPQDRETLCLENALQWMGIKITLVPTSKDRCNLSFINLQHDEFLQKIHEAIGTNPEEIAAKQKAASHLFNEEEVRSEEKPRTIEPPKYFPEAGITASTIMIQRHKYNKDGSVKEWDTPNKRWNDDSKPSWYPGYGNLPNDGHFQRKWGLPLLADPAWRQHSDLFRSQAAAQPHAQSMPSINESNKKTD